MTYVAYIYGYPFVANIPGQSDNSQGDLIARQSEHGQVFRPEGPRHTLVQQGLNQLDLPHAELQTKLSGRHIIQLPVELSEACPH